MKEVITTTMAALTAFAFICVGAWYVQPQPQPEPVTLAQVQTDRATSYPAAQQPDRSYFVEKVQ
jgi:hypothetical protein